jgi:hypothetical protein
VESRWEPGSAAWLTWVVAIAVVLALLLAGGARAVTPGRNGRLLIGASQGTRFSATGVAAPHAHVADCSPGPPDALWTVRPDGSDLQSVGLGSRGQFSPGGRTLMIDDAQPCASSVSLSLSFAPFGAERSIRGALGGGEGDAWFGPWLGPERPSVFDDNGRYIDARTGHRLLPGSGYSDASAGNPPQASCDGRVAFYGSPISSLTGSPAGSSLAIVSRVRSGRRVVAAKRWIVASRTAADYIDAQWSADGRYLFYVLHRGRANSSSLWRVRSDSRGRRLLYTDRSDSDLGASVSPDGRWVLLGVLAGANEELWLIRSDGRGLHPLAVGTAGGYLTTSAEWSPRGDRLFVSEDRTAVGPPPRLVGPTTRVAFVIRPDGRARHVVPYPATASALVWSPDERDVAYDIGGGVAITPVAGGPARTVLSAVEPFAPGATGPSVVDWQAVPGTGRPFRCRNRRPPF